MQAFLPSRHSAQKESFSDLDRLRVSRTEELYCEVQNKNDIFFSPAPAETAETPQNTHLYSQYRKLLDCSNCNMNFDSIVAATLECLFV